MKVYCSPYNQPLDNFSEVRFFEKFDLLPIFGERYTEYEWVDNYQDADIVFFRSTGQMPDEDWQRFFNLFHDKQLLVDASHVLHLDDITPPYAPLFEKVEFYEKFLNNDRFMVLHCYVLPQNIKHINLQYINYSQALTKAFIQGGEIEDAIYAYGGDQRSKNITSTGWFYPEYLEKESFTLTDLDSLQKPVWGQEPYKHGHDTVCMYLSLNTVPNRKHFNHQYAYLDDPNYEFNVERRNIFRKRLYDELLAYPGHLSNKEMGTVILTQTTKIDLLKQIIRENFAPSCTPVMNEYYETSVISTIIETITKTSSVFAFTEKTFFPLVKGHFIMPFSKTGAIDFLKREYGLQFPNWIDYSYDAEEDDVLRFERYILSIKKLLNRGHEWLFDKKFQDLEMLKHNRKQILDRWYGSFYQAHQNFNSQLNDK